MLNKTWSRRLSAPAFAVLYVFCGERSENKIGGKLFYFPPTRLFVSKLFS